MPFSALNNPGCFICGDSIPIDFTDVDWFTLDINFLAPTDFRAAFDFIDTGIAPPQVPEPATGLLVAASLLLLGRQQRGRFRSPRQSTRRER